MANEYKFKCLDCKIDFSIASESGNINKLNEELKRGVRCPKCDNKWGEANSKIELQLQVGAVRNNYKSLESKRKENQERSIIANRQAAAFAQTQMPEKMVQVKGSPKTKFCQQVEAIPERVIDSIAGKAGDL